jgi:hypothetical protein
MATDNGRSHESPVGLPSRLCIPRSSRDRSIARAGSTRKSMTGGGSWVTSATATCGLLSRTSPRSHPALPRAGRRHCGAGPAHADPGRRGGQLRCAAHLPRFEWLRQRDAEAVATPPISMVFDLLRTGPQDLRGAPLRTRRAALERLVRDQTLIFPALRLAASGLTAWDEVQQRGGRGPGRQGRGLTLCGRAYAVLAEGQAARLSSGRSRLPVPQPSGAISGVPRFLARPHPGRSLPPQASGASPNLPGD